MRCYVADNKTKILSSKFLNNINNFKVTFGLPYEEYKVQNNIIELWYLYPNTMEAGKYFRCAINGVNWGAYFDETTGQLIQ